MLKCFFPSFGKSQSNYQSQKQPYNYQCLFVCVSSILWTNLDMMYINSGEGIIWTWKKKLWNFTKIQSPHPHLLKVHKVTLRNKYLFICLFIHQSILEHMASRIQLSVLCIQYLASSKSLDAKWLIPMHKAGCQCWMKNAGIWMPYDGCIWQQALYNYRNQHDFWIIYLWPLSPE